MYMEIKKKHGGAQHESMLIKYYADQWCRDNGYPLQERRYNKNSPIPKRENVRIGLKGKKIFLSQF